MWQKVATTSDTSNTGGVAGGKSGVQGGNKKKK